ncbi:MAG: enoyl-CoA hydratase/isomerase family protein [Nocardioidaceae bacterium]|nr:enoyl-CoA hydratase/isomerase family protein [Nocardioidaceae bacterium]
MSTEPVLKVESDGPVRIVTLNRPDALNSMTDDLHTALGDVWQKLSRDWDARAVVLTGAGRAFSAGGDVPGFIETTENVDNRRSGIRDAGRLVTEMLRFHLPVVGAINGPAVGLGASVAVMCDLVVMSEKSFMSDPHVAIGLVAGDGGVVTWPAMMSILKAKEYLLLGDRIQPAEALALGLANRVVPPEELMPTALELAHRLAALPPQAVQDTKRAINLHLQNSAAQVLPFALASEELSFTTDAVRALSKKFAEEHKK